MRELRKKRAFLSSRISSPKKISTRYSPSRREAICPV